MFCFYSLCDELTTEVLRIRNQFNYERITILQFLFSKNNHTKILIAHNIGIVMLYSLTEYLYNLLRDE